MVQRSAGPTEAVYLPMCPLWTDREKLVEVLRSKQGLMILCKVSVSKMGEPFVVHRWPHCIPYLKGRKKWQNALFSIFFPSNNVFLVRNICWSWTWSIVFDTWVLIYFANTKRLAVYNIRSNYACLDFLKWLFTVQWRRNVLIEKGLQSWKLLGLSLIRWLLMCNHHVCVY